MPDNQSLPAGLSLFFAAGKRPTADDIARLLATSEASLLGARISHRPDDHEGWLELLASGLTFDLAGLAPATSAPIPKAAHRFGVGEDIDPAAIEAISLHPGHHISGGRALMPVVKTMVGLVANLSLHLTARAVCWHPAGT